MSLPGPYFAVPQFGHPAQFGQNRQLGYKTQFGIPNVPQFPKRKGDKSSTCRYWFYSRNGCPDSETDCRYAHIDTQYLSPPASQKGTCWHWKYAMGGCKFKIAKDCPYEHRETGVENDAPPQAGQDRTWHVHKLEGINLAIANAAEKAGFPVHFKRPLMELVFAVRRAGGLGDCYRPKPPHHPIYPDKYRPGKRKYGDNDERGEIVGNLSRHAVTIGTVDNPINLEESDEGAGLGARLPNSSAKRQKQDGVLPIRCKMTDSRAGTPKAFNSQRAHRSPPPPYRRSGYTASPSRQGFEDSGSALLTVEQTLIKNTEMLAECNNIMSELWGADIRFRRLEVVPMLKDLKVHLDDSVRRSQEAIVDLGHVMRWMRV